jgi:DNA-binding transcriptional LysR family regulator
MYQAYNLKPFVSAGGVPGLRAMSTDDYNKPIAIPDYLIRYATLRQLQVFEAIFRHESVTRASEELFLSQPTVSAQVKKLAEAIGLPLFEQAGRGVKPTQAAQELYEACRSIFEALAALEVKIAEIKGIKRGRLRLCVVTTAKYIAPELLGAFSQQHKGIEVSLKVANRDSVIDRMQVNVDDLYMMGQTPTAELGVEAFPFAPNPLVVMAPRNHPLVGKKNIPLSRIAEEPLVLREPGSGIRDATLHKFAEAGLQPKIRMVLGSNEAIKHAVVGGLGLSVLSLHTLTLEGGDGPVAVLDVEGFPIQRQWYLVYPKGKELSLVARSFLEYAIASGPSIRQRLEQLWPGLINA